MNIFLGDGIDFKKALFFSLYLHFFNVYIFSQLVHSKGILK